MIEEEALKKLELEQELAALEEFAKKQIEEPAPEPEPAAEPAPEPVAAAMAAQWGGAA